MFATRRLCLARNAEMIRIEITIDTREGRLEFSAKQRHLKATAEEIVSAGAVLAAIADFTEGDGAALRALRKILDKPAPDQPAPDPYVEYCKDEPAP